MDRTIKTGEIFLHFKGNRYRVIAIAQHTETGEEMVVYQPLEESGSTFVRPIDHFMSEVDKEKYPEILQKYRFEKESDDKDLLMDFLDAEFYADKIDIFKQMKDKLDERLINNVAASMDIVLEDEPMEKQYETILQYMNTRGRFETRRLR